MSVNPDPVGHADGYGGHEGRKPDDQADCKGRTRSSQVLGLYGVGHGQKAIQGHKNQRPDTGDHAGELKIVHQLADVRSQWPVDRGRVDYGVERNAKDEKDEISYSQVDDERICGVGKLVFILEDYGYDKHVAQAADYNDDAENERDYYELVSWLATQLGFPLFRSRQRSGVRNQVRIVFRGVGTWSLAFRVCRSFCS